MSGAFGEEVRARRVAARLTQAELAERAGVSERTISDIERGVRRGVYAVTARALVEALGLAAEDRAGFEAAARPRRSPVAGWPADKDSWRAIRRTPMVGRDGELAAVLAALSDGETRLLTITGPGGIGKSRLAAEACARLEVEAPGGLCWVSLASLRDPDLVLATVAAAVGVAVGGDVALPVLARTLTDRASVLVLDTFEPVLSAAPSVASLLDRTTGLRLLVTSRAPLRLRGECELPLTALPDRPAAELFVQRARSARPGLDVDDDQAVGVIGDICGQLSGVPLALELAAAKVRHMSLPALRNELARPLRLLIDGERDLPRRQRTMRATIAWSHDLLSTQERVVFRRLSRFAGGWTLAAAESVCGQDGELSMLVLAAVGRLCEHGLVQADDAAAIARWHMLDPIHEFAVQQLAGTRDGSGVAQRHAEWFAVFAEAAATLLLGPDQASGREQLRAEAGNLRVALGWAIETGAVDVALRLAGASWMFWRMEGAFDEGRSWLARALAVPGAGESRHRADALWGAAWLAYAQLDHAAAAGFGEELLALAAVDGNRLHRHNALSVLGHVAITERRPDDALALLEEALEIARASGERWHLATSLLNLGTAVLHHGDRRRAQQLLEEAVAGYERAGDRHFLARSLVELGYAALVSGNERLSATRFGDALRTFLDLHERWGAAESLAGLAVLAAARGDADTAAVLIGASDATYDEIASQVTGPDAAIGAPALRAARATLGESSWRRGIARGARMTIEESAQLALQQLCGKIAANSAAHRPASPLSPWGS